MGVFVYWIGLNLTTLKAVTSHHSFPLVTSCFH